MGILWKDVLWLGKWTTPDGRSLTVRRPDLQTVVANGRKMLAENLGIPWCWDHQPDAMPVEMSHSVYAHTDRRANFTRNVITPKTVAFEVRQGENGPAVFAGFDTDGLSKDEVEQIKRAGNVSCRIDRGFWDARGKGRKYDGLSISHIAVTPKPLEPNQGPFFMSALRCADESFFLGYGTMAKENGEPDGDEPTNVETAPANDDTMDPVDLEVADEPAIEPAVEVPPVAEVPPPPPAVDPLVQSVMGSLAALGIPLPADGSITDLGGLNLALKIAVSMGAKATAGEDNMNCTGGDTTTANPPMLMSQSAMAQKYPDRVDNDRRNLKSQINLLFKQGKINGPIRDAMLQEFESFEMSYSGSRLCVRGLLSAVQQLKKLVPVGTFLGRGKSFDMSQTTQVNPPDSLVADNKKAQEDADAAALREQIRRNNIRRGAVKQTS